MPECFSSQWYAAGLEDETIWLEAPSRQAAEKFAHRNGRGEGTGWLLKRISHKTWEEGLDCVVDEQGAVVERATPTIPGVQQ